jgi:Short C-terminal domain
VDHVGGALGGITAVTAVATRFWNGQQGGVRIAVVAATGAVIAGVAIALAIIVSSDVRARASGAVAIYDARARVAVKLLDVSSAVKPAPPKATTPSPATVLEQLLKVKELKDQGLLTDDEFAEQKAKILG